jgi:signal transduction histidine kinase
MESTDVMSAEGSKSYVMSRVELSRLAEEQAVLRRVAALVARGAPPAEVFEVVSAEVGRLIAADAAALGRYETDGMIASLGSWSRTGGDFTPGTRFPLVPGTAAWLVFEEGRPGRIESYEGVRGSAPAAVREAGWRSSVGTPLVVERRLWGVLAVGSKSERPLPLDTEQRLAKFAELVTTAIANAETRTELHASRARIVATADATRRRIERDLHDGVQQQLVSLALELRAAQAATPPELREHRADLSRVVEGLTSVSEGLREIALGIHPTTLAEAGLHPALKTLARRAPLEVELDVRVRGRLPEAVEVAAYYVVSEGLTNAVKHAGASVVRVRLEARGSILDVAVHDEGLGGADPAHGSGLLGLKDRAEALGGTISLQSARGAGTRLHVELPIDDQNYLSGPTSSPVPS